MADYDIILNRFYKFLVDTVPNSVVKMSNTAKKYETVETKRLGDRYVSACMQTDSFYSYPTISKRVLELAGFNEDEISVYSVDKSLIPNDRRDIVIKLAREEFIAEYEEENDYYRMLNGLPSIDGTQEIWLLDFDLYDKYEIEPCPIHEIKHEIILAMEKRGELDDIRKVYPEAKFLQYIGIRKISIVDARKAENFAILYFPTIDESYSFYRNFLMYYNECREYFLTVIYNNYYTSKYEQYDGFIGFTIMMMTVNRMISSNIKVFIERDFYDELSVRIFLSAYGLDCDTVFTLTQLKLLAKNLNIMLRNKSTDIVLLDVLDLLGYTEFELTKYYLVKSHKFTEDGKPIFEYKTEVDENGVSRKVLDTSKMFDYKFVRVNVEDDNVQNALNDASAYIPYRSVTTEDPYWVQDEKLIKMLNETKFNYLDTKYMDMSIVYRMHAIMFEIIYFSRMVLDKGFDTKNIMVTLSSISMYADVSLFDAIIYLICITCKYFKVRPNLLVQPDNVYSCDCGKTFGSHMEDSTCPECGTQVTYRKDNIGTGQSKVLHILGFNFKADFDKIREDINKNPNMKKTELLKYINDCYFSSADDVNKMYKKIKNLDKLLIDLMNETPDYETYNAYKTLYETLMITDVDNSIYALSDGTIPKEFPEYLQESNPILYESYMKIETQEECSEMIEYVTTRLTIIFNNTEYLKYLQITNDSLIDAVLKILNFFKSLTIQIRGANIIILFDSRFYNSAHVYHKLKESGELNITDVIPGDYFWDSVKEFNTKMSELEEVVTNTELQRAVVDYYMPDGVLSETRLQDSIMTESIYDYMINTMDICDANVTISKLKSSSNKEDRLLIDDIETNMSSSINVSDNVKFIWGE